MRVGAYRVVIWLPPREHGPPHVHVQTTSGEVVIELAVGGEIGVSTHPIKAATVAVRVARAKRIGGGRVMVGLWREWNETPALHVPAECLWGRRSL